MPKKLVSECMKDIVASIEGHLHGGYGSANIESTESIPKGGRRSSEKRCHGGRRGSSGTSISGLKWKHHGSVNQHSHHLERTRVLDFQILMLMLIH